MQGPRIRLHDQIMFEIRGLQQPGGDFQNPPVEVSTKDTAEQGFLCLPGPHLHRQGGSCRDVWRVADDQVILPTSRLSHDIAPDHADIGEVAAVVSGEAEGLGMAIYGQDGRSRQMAAEGSGETSGASPQVENAQSSIGRQLLDQVGQPVFGLWTGDQNWRLHPEVTTQKELLTNDIRQRHFPPNQL